MISDIDDGNSMHCPHCEQGTSTYSGVSGDFLCGSCGRWRSVEGDGDPNIPWRSDSRRPSRSLDSRFNMNAVELPNWF